MLISLNKLKRFLVPLDSISVNKDLSASIKNSGVIVPVVMNDGLVIDGHRRIIAAGLAKIDQIPCIQAEQDPYNLYAELNQHRQVMPLEGAILVKQIKDNRQKMNFCRQNHISASPQMIGILEYLATHRGSYTPDQINSIPLNTWRELAHLDFSNLLPWFIQINGTVSAKRQIAGLLRQCQRLGHQSYPLDEIQADEVIKKLKQIAQPRRSKVLENFEQAVDNIDLPAGIKINIDSTFNKPGIDFNLHITRKSLSRFKQASDIAGEIFAKVEEL